MQIITLYRYQRPEGGVTVMVRGGDYEQTRQAGCSTPC